MNNNPRFTKKRLSQIIAAGLLTGLGTTAYANDYSLVDNEFVIKNNSTVVAEATVGSNGILQTSTLPQIDVTSSTLPNGLPSFEFQIASGGLLTNTSHSFKVGLSISDNADPTNRRFEAYIGTLTLSVDGSGNVTGTIPNQSMSVSVKKGSATFSDSISNPSTNGPVSISGSTLTFSGSDAVSRLRAQSNDVLKAVLDDFALNGTFTFRVVVQETTSARTGTGATAAQVGVTSGSTFTAVPRIATTCALNSASTVGNVFQLLNSTGFTNAYAIQGQFRAGTGGTANLLSAFTETCTATSTGGGGTDTPANPVDDTAVNNTGTAANAVNDAINSGSSEQAQTALTNVASSLETIANSVTGGAVLSSAQQAQVQASVQTLFSNAETLLNNVGNDEVALTAAVNALNNALAAMQRANVPATATIVNRVVAAGQASARNEARRKSGLPADATPAQVAAALSTDPAALEASIRQSIRIPPTEVRTPAQKQVTFTNTQTLRGVDFSDYVSNSDTYDQILKQTIANSMIGVSNDDILDLVITNSNISTLVSDDRTGGAFALSDDSISATVKKDDVTGILTIEFPGEAYAGYVKALRAVPDEIPTGIRILRDGTAVVVNAGYAMELAPVPVDTLSFSLAVLQAGFSGLSFNGDDAAYRIDFGGGQRFAGVFAFDNLTGQPLDFNCGGITIAEPTIEPTAAEYSFGVNCANGVQQRLLPHMDNTNFFASLTAAQIPYQVDRSTGIITSEGNGRFKPSFFISPLTAAETSFHAANKDANGVAFQAMDVNGDGRIDFKVIAPNGTQVLYGVN